MSWERTRAGIAKAQELLPHMPIIVTAGAALALVATHGLPEFWTVVQNVFHGHNLLTSFGVYNTTFHPAVYQPAHDVITTQVLTPASSSFNPTTGGYSIDGFIPANTPVGTHISIFLDPIQGTPNALLTTDYHLPGSMQAASSQTVFTPFTARQNAEVATTVATPFAAAIAGVRGLRSRH